MRWPGQAIQFPAKMQKSPIRYASLARKPALSGNMANAILATVSMDISLRKPREESATSPMNLKFAFRALAHRNFQLFFAGQTISLIGTWMQQVAMAWLVYLKTESPLWLGIVGFASQVPAFFLAPVAGVLVDHWNRHRLILVTQSLAMIQAFILAGLTLGGVIEVWHILALSTFMGLINAFDMPARQAFLSEMIGSRDDLANAIALNSSMFNGARLIGPALVAAILAKTHHGVCFLLNTHCLFA